MSSPLINAATRLTSEVQATWSEITAPLLFTMKQPSMASKAQEDKSIALSSL